MVVLLALLAWMVKCLLDQQTTTASTVEKVSERMGKAAESSVTAISSSFTTSIVEVAGRLTDLTELLMLGRDSPPPSESLPTNWNEPEPSNEPAIDLSALPDSAAWAMEEESALTQMPWQSSTQQPDSELTL